MPRCHGGPTCATLDLSLSIARKDGAISALQDQLAHARTELHETRQQLHSTQQEILGIE